MQKLINNLIRVFIIGIFCCSCTRLKDKSFVDKLNAFSISDTSHVFSADVSETIKCPQGRNFLYVLDASCSVCIANYLQFIKKVEELRFDSLIVVARESYDFAKVEYYLKETGLKHPQNMRIIMDPKNNIYNEFVNIYFDHNLFLLENKRILFSVNTYDVQY